MALPSLTVDARAGNYQPYLKERGRIVHNPPSIDTVIQGFRAEQRRDPRRPVSIGVRVFWRGGSAGLIEALGVVRDISAHGFGIELAQCLPKGELLSVQTTAGALQGIVRHVRQFSGGYIVGVEVLLASDGSDHQRSLRNLEIAIAEAEKSR